MHTPCPLRLISVPLLVAAMAAPTLAASQIVVAPPTLATTPGNGQAFTAPFNDPSRYQQIYAASQFSTLPGPEMITQIAFRPAVGQGAFSRTFSATVSLSTTAQAVAGLSATYANNVGANSTVVFSGPLTLNSTGDPGVGAGPFDILIPLTTPFLYNPSQGNLLFDFTNLNGAFTGYVDGSFDTTPTPLTRLVFTDNSTTSTSGTVQSFGLVTRFTFQAAAVPESPSFALLVLGLLPVGLVAMRRR